MLPNPSAPEHPPATSPTGLANQRATSCDGVALDLDGTDTTSPRRRLDQAAASTPGRPMAERGRCGWVIGRAAELAAAEIAA